MRDSFSHRFLFAIEGFPRRDESPQAEFPAVHPLGFSVQLCGLAFFLFCGAQQLSFLLRSFFIFPLLPAALVFLFQ